MLQIHLDLQLNGLLFFFIFLYTYIMSFVTEKYILSYNMYLNYFPRQLPKYAYCSQIMRINP